MRHFFTARHAFAICSLVVLCAAGRRDWPAATAARENESSRPPLEIGFLPASGLYAKEGEFSCQASAGNGQVYDPLTGAFHIHFEARNFTRGGFEVAKVAEPITRPVVFRLTGVPTGYGCLGHPLVLTVGEKRYALDPSCQSLYWRNEERFDATLFRSARKGNEITLEFTEKGRVLLMPGAKISLEVDTGW